MANRLIFSREQKVGGRTLYAFAEISEDNIITIERDSITGKTHHIMLKLKELKEILNNAESGINLTPPQKGG